MLFNSKEVKDLKLFIGVQVPLVKYFKEAKEITVSFGSFYSNDDKLEIVVYEGIKTIKEAKILMQEVHDELVGNIGFRNAITTVKE